MNKKSLKVFTWSILMLALVFAPSLSLADTTVGTNLSTTGTFTMTKTSATAAQFQNAGGSVVFLIDTTNTRVGVAYGTNLDTKFEVGGTASATNTLVSGAVQFAGNASVSYSRFGTGATGHGLSASNDLLITGFTEFDKKAYFDATASATYFFSQNAAQFAGNASVAYSRFGTGTTGHGLSASNDLLITGFTEFDKKTYFDATASAAYFFSRNAAQFAGNASVAYSRFGTGATGHSLAAANDLLVTGLLEIDGNAFFDSKASISSNLQISGRFIADTAASNSFTGDLTVTRAARVGTTGYQDTTFEVGGTASVATNFNVGENSTATTSITFETSATDKGVCISMKNTAGTVQYLRLFGSTLTINTTNCNQ